MIEANTNIICSCLPLLHRTISSHVLRTFKATSRKLSRRNLVTYHRGPIDRPVDQSEWNVHKMPSSRIDSIQDTSPESHSAVRGEPHQSRPSQGVRYSVGVEHTGILAESADQSMTITKDISYKIEYDT